MQIKLSKFKRQKIYGNNYFKNFFWYLINNLIISSFIPSSNLRKFLLSMFGAKIGDGVILKPKIYVKFPWKLKIGNNTWIGEKVWIDNIETVSIGDDCCVSQGVYFCTGNHDFKKETFDLIAEKIEVKNNSWIAAMAKIGPGVILNEGSFIKLGQVIVKKK